MQGIRESAGWGPASWWPRAISSSSRTQTDPHPSQGTGGAASLSVGGCQTEKGIVEWVTREPLLSTEYRAIPSRMAVREFLKLANPEDEVLLIEFNSSPRLVVPLTGDTSEIESKLLFSDAKGSTALLDAIYFSVHEIKKSKKSKKALFIISDGEDNSSRYNEAEIASIVSESDVLVYGIGSSRGGARHRSAILKNLADQTGGLFFDENPGKLPEAAKAMSDDLRSRYVAGYSPHNQRRDGLYHRLEVKVIPPPNSPKLTAHWRRGYYSPLE